MSPLLITGLGATLVSVVAVVWRCAIPESERRYSCRLLSAIELVDRVRWPSPSSSAAGGGRTARTGAGSSGQQRPQHGAAAAAAAGGGGAMDASRPAANASSDYDYGYWCGGGPLCPEYRHPHNHHRHITANRQQIYVAVPTTSSSSSSSSSNQQHLQQPNHRSSSRCSTVDRPEQPAAVPGPACRRPVDFGPSASSYITNTNAASMPPRPPPSYASRSTSSTHYPAVTLPLSSGTKASADGVRCAVSETSSASGTTSAAARGSITAGCKTLQSLQFGYRTLQSRRPTKRVTSRNGVSDMEDNDDDECIDEKRELNVSRQPSSSVMAASNAEGGFCHSRQQQAQQFCVRPGWATAPSSRRFLLGLSTTAVVGSLPGAAAVDDDLRRRYVNESSGSGSVGALMNLPTETAGRPSTVNHNYYDVRYGTVGGGRIPCADRLNNSVDARRAFEQFD